MKGLLKNNFYATLSNAKVFAAIMLLLGIFVVAMDNKIPSLIIGYMLLAMIGFSLNSIASLRKESATKWSKYKLTTPVKRSAHCTELFFELVIVADCRNGLCGNWSSFINHATWFPF